MDNGTSRIPVDVALVIALDEEFGFLRAVVANDFAPLTIDSQPYYRFAFSTAVGQQRDGVALFLGDMGIEVAERKTRRLLDHFAPLVVANVGISGLLSEDLRLGDVVVAKTSWNYTYRGKVVAPGDPNSLTFSDIQFGGQSLPTSPALHQFFKNVKRALPDEWKRLTSAHREFVRRNFTRRTYSNLRKRKLIDTTFSVYCEDVASGPFVGAARLFKDWLKMQNRNYFALDMESYCGCRSHPA